jgi:hypothetical protein
MTSRKWRTLEEVVRSEPELAYLGFGVYGPRGKTGAARGAQVIEAREELLQSVDIFNSVCAFISDHLVERPYIRQQGSSYVLKHAVERALGAYVSNGVLIAAMIACGFRHRRKGTSGGPNALFNTTAESVKAVQHMNKKLKQGWARAWLEGDAGRTAVSPGHYDAV